MDDLKHIIISLASIGAVFGIIYVLLMTRYKERMAMIDKNVPASLFISNGSVSPTLKFGMLFVGIALGIITAEALHEFYDFNRGFTFFAMVFLFGGISLILNFIVERRLREKEDEKQS